MKGKNKGNQDCWRKNPHVFVPRGANTLYLMMAYFTKESIHNKGLCGGVQKQLVFSVETYKWKEQKIKKIHILHFILLQGGQRTVSTKLGHKCTKILKSD